MNLSKELKKKRDSEDRLRQTSPQKVFFPDGFIDLSQFANKNHTHKFIDLTDTPSNYVADKFVKVNSAGTAFEYGDGGGLAEIPQATETKLGGIKAKAKTTETKEVVVDTETGKLYVNDSSGGYSTKSISFYVDDVLEVGTNQISIICPQAMTIIGIRLAVDVAPTGTSLIIDINKNGTTLYTTQANRPTIAAGNSSGTATLPDTTSLSLGDKITLDIDQIGSTVAGENLSVIVICEVV